MPIHNIMTGNGCVGASVSLEIEKSQALMGSDLDAHQTGKAVLVRVAGKIIHCSERDIAVEITDPYQGISCGRHIPYFAGGHSRFMQQGGLSPHGIQTAENILLHLYRWCGLFERYGAVLTDRFNQAIWRHLADNPIPLATLQDAQKTLRQQLKAGAISSPEYQRRQHPLKQLVSEHQQLGFRALMDVGDFVKSQYGETIPYDTIEILLKNHAPPSPPATEAVRRGMAGEGKRQLETLENKT